MVNTILLSALCFSGPILKVRVDGDGYLRFIRDGRAVYAKEATLEIQDGKLTNAAGDGVLPTISVGPDAQDLASDLEGNLFVTYRGSKAKVGQLVLAQFPASESFRPEDVVLAADDRPHLGNPGDDTIGVIRVVAGFDQPTLKLDGKVGPIATPKPPAKAGTFVKSDDLSQRFLQKTEAAHAASQTGQKGQPIQITIQPHSVAHGDHIYLGEVAQIDGDPALAAKLADVDLGDTPPVGVRRIVDRGEIPIRLRAAGYKPEDFTISVPQDAEIRRKGQNITNAEFVVVATKAMLASGGLSGTWESTDTFADLEVPSGNLELKAEQTQGANTDSASVVVGIYIDSNRFNSRTVHLHLKESVPPVQIGQVVKVLIRAGNAEVELPGIARSAGHLGQAIQVEVQVGNPPVKTTHTGVVTAAGTVEVKL